LVSQLPARLLAVGADFQRRAGGVRLPTRLATNLIDRRADADVAAVGLERMHAGQVDGLSAGVIAAAVAEGVGLPGFQAAEDEHLVLEGGQRWSVRVSV